MGKTLWKSQNMSLNGFFWGKHHPAPAVCFPWENLFLYRLCDFQTVFLIETQFFYPAL